MRQDTEKASKQTKEQQRVDVVLTTDAGKAAVAPRCPVLLHWRLMLANEVKKPSLV